MHKKFLFVLFILNGLQFSEDYVYVIGVVTIDVKKNSNLPKNYTYVFTSYIKWLEENNLRWIQISIYDSPIALYNKLRLVDGVFLTGGTQELEDDYGYPTFYKNTLISIFEYAKYMNDQNVRFPVIATCLGFESMVMILTNEELKLKPAANKNESQNIYLLPESNQSFLTQIFTFEDLNEFSKNYVFYFSHHNGFLMKDVLESKIFQENISALGFYITDTDQRALGIIQHKYYPFIAWQFHPEKVQFEHNDGFQINNSKDSRHINSQFGKVFNLFLQGQLVKKVSNKQILNIRSKVKLIENYNNNDEAYVFPADDVQLIYIYQLKLYQSSQITHKLISTNIYNKIYAVIYQKSQNVLAKTFQQRQIHNRVCIFRLFKLLFNLIKVVHLRKRTIYSSC